MFQRCEDAVVQFGVRVGYDALPCLVIDAIVVCLSEFVCTVHVCAKGSLHVRDFNGSLSLARPWRGGMGDCPLQGQSPQLSGVLFRGQTNTRPSGIRGLGRRGT